MAQRKGLDNRGVSLLELVVVMAIIVIISGLAVWGVGALFSKPAEQCAKQMQIMLEKHRVTAMGKNEAEIYLYIADDGRVMMQEKINGGPAVQHCVGAKGVVVKYKVSNDPDDNRWNTISKDAGMTISFSRATGSLNSATVNGTTTWVKEYEISKGDVTKKLKIVPLTGKITVE